MDQLGERERYRLLVNTVLPRPIALVTTCDQQGRVNTAPFSFFNVMGSEPAVLALGLENDAHSADGLKDTTRNILATGQFVVNLIGILTSMFSSVVGVRALVNLWYGNRRRLQGISIGQVWKPQDKK